MLARKDAPASYHLCVTHDDALQGVTLVTRGATCKPATDLHRLLQALMGWPAPRYAHHALLTDAAGRRLAKRDRAATLREMRAAGMTPAELRERLRGPGTRRRLARAAGRKQGQGSALDPPRGRGPWNPLHTNSFI